MGRSPTNATPQIAEAAKTVATTHWVKALADRLIDEPPEKLGMMRIVPG
jgi:hypothetical protein